MTPRNYPKVLLYTGITEDSGSAFLRSDRRKAIKAMSEGDEKYLDTLLISSAKNDIIKSKFLKACMICDNEAGKATINFMNLLTFMLRIGCKNPVIMESEYGNSLATDWQAKQHSLYKMQEIALFIASNWDVQGYLYKYLAHEINIIRDRTDDAHMIRDRTDDAQNLRQERTADNMPYTPSELYEAIDNTLNGINSSSFRDYVLSLYNRKLPEGGTQRINDNFMLQSAYMTLQLTVYNLKRSKTSVGWTDPFIRGLDFDDIFVRQLVGAEKEPVIIDVSKETDATPVDPDFARAQRLSLLRAMSQLAKEVQNTTGEDGNKRGEE